MAKYGVRRKGWDILDTNAHHSAFQRSCCLVKEMFLSNIEFRMGMGVHVLFWLARPWVGQSPRQSQRFSDVRGICMLLLVIIQRGLEIMWSGGVLFGGNWQSWKEANFKRCCRKQH